VLLLVLNRKKESPDYQAAGEAAVKTDSGTRSWAFYMTPIFSLFENTKETAEDGPYHMLGVHPPFPSPLECTPKMC
jgi:hypothetical protein